MRRHLPIALALLVAHPAPGNAQSPTGLHGVYKGIYTQKFGQGGGSSYPVKVEFLSPNACVRTESPANAKEFVAQCTYSIAGDKVTVLYPGQERATHIYGLKGDTLSWPIDFVIPGCCDRGWARESLIKKPAAAKAPSAAPPLRR